MRSVIDVKDTGEGIPQDKRESIFQPFVQVESAGRRRFGGAGLGLPISRRLSKAMGGSLVLLDTGPAGSTFRLSLPLDASDDPPLEDQSTRILQLVHGHIFIAEDDPACQYVAQTLLEGSALRGHRGCHWGTGTDRRMPLSCKLWAKLLPTAGASC